MASFDIGKNNFAYCIAEISSDHSITLENIHVIDLTQGKKKCTLLDVCRVMTEHLKEEKPCDYYLIEQQPASNVTMQRLSQHLWSSLTLMYPLAKICFISAKLKFDPECKRLTYSQRKQWSVNKIMANTIPHVDMTLILPRVTALPKKDDICDAILQLIVFVQKRDK